MKLLINDKEIAHFLLSTIDYLKSCKDIDLKWTETETDPLPWWDSKRRDYENFNKEKWKDKLYQKLRKSVEMDTKRFFLEMQHRLREVKKKHYNLVHKNIEYFIEKIGEEKILELYKKNKKQNFVKSVGLSLDKKSVMLRRKKFLDHTQDCLIRNTVGNEQLLIDKIDHSLPFWFIDSGYTNFLEKNKVWHRLVRNHLHYGRYFEAPTNRLNCFPKFPKPWRGNGHAIMIVEPGPFAAGIFHVDLKTWKYEIEKQIRQYSDKKIVFREKAPKKERSNLYKHFLGEDYHCIININSNAATEAIWAGIPAITLDRHITNPVSSNKISDVSDPLKPNLANWLCMLSYSQFTFDELISGRAGRIVKRYHV